MKGKHLAEARRREREAEREPAAVSGVQESGRHSCSPNPEMRR